MQHKSFGLTLGLSIFSICYLVSQQRRRSFPKKYGLSISTIAITKRTGSRPKRCSTKRTVLTGSQLTTFQRTAPDSPAFESLQRCLTMRRTAVRSIGTITLLPERIALPRTRPVPSLFRRRKTIRCMLSLANLCGRWIGRRY